MVNTTKSAEGLSSMKRALLAIDKLQAKINQLESQAPENQTPEPIAIIGAGCRFPGGANSPEALWELLRDGIDTLEEIPSERWDVEAYYEANPDVPGKMYTRSGAFVKDADAFDAAFFGISPREAELMDPQQRLFLEVCWEALERAGEPADQLIGSPTGVFAGVMYTDYSRIDLGGATSIDAYSSTGNSLSVVAGRVSYLLGLQGPSVTLDTACSSSLVAIHLACQSLRAKESNLALAGGVSVMAIPDNYVTLCRTRALSPTGRCKTFDADADGFARGEGAGVVTLKRLSDAIADGNPILGVIRGSAVNQDGRSNGLTAPNGPAQQSVLREALKNANLHPHDISYIEAHGTGTPLGDPIEVGAIAAVLGAGRTAQQPLALGSVKTNLGHLESAAGIAGLMKVLLAMQHRKIPPHLHLNKLNSYIDWGTQPISIPTELTPWGSPTDRPIAGVSAFGFSGTNAHLIVEAPPLPAETTAANVTDSPAASPTTPDYLLPLSARTPDALKAIAQSYCQFLQGHSRLPVTSVAEIAHTASHRRSHHAYRLSVVGKSTDQWAEQLNAFLRDETRPGLSVHEGIATTAPSPVFVFSGQGSQWVGMGQQLLTEAPMFRETLERCDQILSPLTGWSLLHELTSNSSRLNETEVAQPAIVALQIALVALWHHWGIEPAAVVGHSVGEVTAAYVAGVLSLEEALKLVVERSQRMQQATGNGRMAAVGLSAQRIAPFLAEFEGRLSMAAINSPSSTVVAGETEAIAALQQTLVAQNIDCRPLRVDYAFHCAQMEPYRVGLVDALGSLLPQPAKLPLYSTVTGERTDGRDWNAHYWGRNLREPVQFAAAVQALIAEGYTHFLEVSPHPILAHNLKEMLQTQPEPTGQVLFSLRRQQEEREGLLGELGRLYSSGCETIRWSHITDASARCVPLPTYAWQHERYWLTPAPQQNAPWQATANGHPLLGHRLPDLAPGANGPEKRVIWQSQIDVRSQSYLLDHKVQGAQVLPGAAYAEMALYAGKAVLGTDEISLETLEFKQALFLPPAEAVTVQVVLQSAAEADNSGHGSGNNNNGHTEDSADRFSFTCYSRSAAETDWRIHAVGHLTQTSRPTPAAPFALSEIQARCTEQISGSEHYQRMAEQGLQYGPNFQGVTQIWRREGEALGRIQPVVNDTHGYQIHPTILDACFQVFGFATPLANPDHPGDGTYLPVYLHQCYQYGSLDTSVLWAHLQLQDLDETDAFEAQVQLWNDRGELVWGSQSLRVQRLEASQQAAALDWFYQTTWEPAAPLAPLPSTPPNLSNYWLIFANGQANPQSSETQSDTQTVTSQLPALLSNQLSSAGCRWVSAGDTYQKQVEQTQEVRYQLNPERPEEFDQLLQSLEQETDHCLGIVYLWGLDATPMAALTEDHLASDSLLTCVGPLHLVQSLAQRDWRPQTGLWLITQAAQAVMGKGEGVTPSQSALWGLARVIAQEFPSLPCHRIDLAADVSTPEVKHLTHILMAQLSTVESATTSATTFNPREDQLALRGGNCYQARLKRYALSPQEPSVQADGTYLITGGLKGLGLQVAQWLVAKGARHLALLGRSRPNEDTQATLNELAEQGVHIEVVQADVTQANAMAQVFSDLSQTLPPLKGVIHSAAVLNDGVLLQQTAERFAKVMGPKANGAWNLHMLTQGESLDFFVLFSSIASLLGSAGQGNYAAANAFLDGLADYRRSQGLPAISINWGAWADIGLAAAQANRGNRMSTQGFDSIPPAQGLAVLGHLLSGEHPPAQVGVMPVNWTKVRQMTPGASQVPFLQAIWSELGELVTAPEPSRLTRTELLELPTGDRLPQLLDYFHTQVARVLRLAPDKLDPHQPLNQQGLDSLVAVELKNTLERDLGVEIPMVNFIQGPSVAQLSEQILTQILASTPLTVTSERTVQRHAPPTANTPITDWEDGEI